MDNESQQSETHSGCRHFHSTKSKPNYKDHFPNGKPFSDTDRETFDRYRAENNPKGKNVGKDTHLCARCGSNNKKLPQKGDICTYCHLLLLDI